MEELHKALSAEDATQIHPSYVSTLSFPKTDNWIETKTILARSTSQPKMAEDDGREGWNIKLTTRQISNPFSRHSIEK
jgi:hypothetical protein